MIDGARFCGAGRACRGCGRIATILGAGFSVTFSFDEGEGYEILIAWKRQREAKEIIENDRRVHFQGILSAHYSQITAAIASLLEGLMLHFFSRYWHVLLTQEYLSCTKQHQSSYRIIEVFLHTR